MKHSRITKKVAAAGTVAGSFGFVGSSPAEAASGFLNCRVNTRSYTLGAPAWQVHSLNGSVVAKYDYYWSLYWGQGGNWSATPNGAASCW